jgi:uncharacterized membrane protein
MVHSWSPPADTMHSQSNEAMQRWLGRVLRVGVATAAILVLFGLVLFVVQDHGHDRTSLDTALGRHTTVRPLHPADVLDGLGAGKPAAFIELGLLVLILTPIVRVAMTLVLFERQRDWTFVALSGVVLAILILGLFGVGA